MLGVQERLVHPYRGMTRVANEHLNHVGVH